MQRVARWDGTSWSAVGDGFDDDETFGGDAALSGIDHARRRCGGGSRCEVRIFENDEGITPETDVHLRLTAFFTF